MTKQELAYQLGISLKDENYNEILAEYTHWKNNQNDLRLREILANRGIDLTKQINIPAPFLSTGNVFTFVDLFAGIGGFRLALQNLGGKCVFSSEWDNAAQETYFRNYGEVPYGDITKIDENAIPNHDILCAGFPCQPFSNAGLKRGIEDTRGTLFYNIAKILQAKHPRVVILENVRGLISNNKGNTIQTVLRTITGMGYKCNVDQQLIDEGPLKKLQVEVGKMVMYSKDFGVPQNRPRVYIVLWRNDLEGIDSFTYPKPNNEENLPLEARTHVGQILENNVPERYTISDRLWAGHQRRKINNEAHGKGFGYCLFTPDSPYTSTISRRYYKDGSEILIYQGEFRNPRKITEREAARLQGYPDTFLMHPSAVEAYKQFGNSVSVPVVQAIGEEIVNQLL